MEKELKEREIITTEENIDKNNHAYFENKENELNNENREFYVYEHIRLDNMTCFYVGKGKGDRIDVLNRNYHHDKISNKYGHAVVIIKNHLTEKEAFKLERERIEYYVFKLGYGIDIKGYRNIENNEYLTNCTWGGEGASGLQLSEEAKQKISEVNKGRKCSEETKRKMSESQKGRVAWNSKKVICITTGKIFNSSRKASNYYNVSHGNISTCCRGKLKSAGKLNGEPLKWKFLENYNNEFKGILINPWNKGKKLSEEHELKLSKVNSKKVICITTGKIFNSCKEASNYYNVSINSISYCCEGIYKSVGKLQWKYVKDYNNDFKGILINPWNKGKKLFEEHELKLSKVNSKKVICITTGKIFNSITEASSYYNASHISSCCIGERKSAGKLNGEPLKWKFLENYNNEFKGILINPWNKGKKLFEEYELKLSKANSKKVICITTGKIFNSITEAGNYYNTGHISNCCRGELKSAGKLNGERLKWKYLENYNNEFKGILINPIMNKRC